MGVGARNLSRAQQGLSLQPAPRRPAGPGEGMRALGRLPIGTMNKTEEAYAGHLGSLEQAGVVLWWRFEPIKLRLADNTFYSADFFVMAADRSLEVHEVKGFWTDDARVKVKVAASLFPIFRFVAVKARAKRDGGGWSEEEF